MIFGDEERERFEKESESWLCKKNSLMKIIVRLGIIVILLVGIEELLIIYVILSLENLILRLWCFITLVGMIAIYL